MHLNVVTDAGHQFVDLMEGHILIRHAQFPLTYHGRVLNSVEIEHADGSPALVGVYVHPTDVAADVLLMRQT